MKTLTTAQTTDNPLEQFYQQLLKSPELQAQLKTASDPESLCQMAVKLGADLGYELTIEQARAAMAIEVALGGDVLEESNLSDDNSIVSIGCYPCFSKR
jgi:Nif11 domain